MTVESPAPVNANATVVSGSRAVVVGRLQNAPYPPRQISPSKSALDVAAPMRNGAGDDGSVGVASAGSAPTAATKPRTSAADRRRGPPTRPPNDLITTPFA